MLIKILLFLPSILLAYNSNFVFNNSHNEYISNDIIVAIAKVESNFNISAIGDNGKSFGIMQISLDAARQVGFKGSEKELLTPKVNIKYAVKYLIWIHKQTENIFETLDAYNRGISAVRKNPFNGSYYNHKYVGKVLNAL